MLSEAKELIDRLRNLVQGELTRTAKPKEWWRHDNDAIGCMCGVGAFLVGLMLAGPAGFKGFFFGTLITYGTILFLLHNNPVSGLRRMFSDVERIAAGVLSLCDSYRPRMTARVDADAAKAERGIEKDFEVFQESLRSPSVAIHEEIAGLWRDSEFAGFDWCAAEWHTWHPATSPAFAARFAKLSADTADLADVLSPIDLRFSLPALAPFPEGRALLFKVAGREKERAAGAVQSVMARLLANVPPAKVRFTLIDPVALGSNVAGLMALSDYEESLVTSRAWSEPDHIEQRLADLTEHMETVIQKYLRTDFRTIHEYNEAAKEIAEPYRIVVVFDFPVNFTDTAARRLGL